MHEIAKMQRRNNEHIFSQAEEKRDKEYRQFYQLCRRRIISRAVVQRDKFSFTFFSFAAGEGIAEYAHCGDILVQLIEGEISVSIEGVSHTLHAGDIIAVPDNTPHGIDASLPSKAILYIVKS